MSVRRLISLTVVLAVFYAYLCYVYQISHPPCCDSGAYAKMGKIYAASGIVDTGFSNIRTYGYPLFLAILWRISQDTGLAFLLLTFIVQTALYVGLSGILSRLLYKEVSRRAGVITMLGLTANILGYPSLSTVLSDGFSIIVQIAIVLVLTSLFLRGERMSTRVWALNGLLLGLMSGFAMIVRPANIHFVGFEFTALMFVLFRIRSTAAVKAFNLVSCATVGFAIAIAPQIVSNWQIFHKITFLPTFDLPGIQLLVGQQRLKYGTLIINGVGTGMPYASPWASIADGTVSWYFRHPLTGFVTAAIHAFGALDFDYLFTYIYAVKIPYRPVLFFLSQSIVFWGCVGWWKMLSAWRTRVQLPDQDVFNRARGFFLIVSGAYVASWLVVYAPSAVENRFALPIVTMGTPLALWAIIEFWRLRDRPLRLLTGFAVYLAGAGIMSAWLSSLRVIA